MTYGDSLYAKKQAMSGFLDELEKTRKMEADRCSSAATHSGKMDLIRRKKVEANEELLHALLKYLYKTSLPFNREYKAAYDCELDDCFDSFMSKYCKDGMCQYITEAKNSGCKPAAAMLEAVEDAVTEHFRGFMENLDETDPEDIDMDVQSPDMQNKIQEISAKLDYDQVSQIITNNVKATVAHEKEMADQEDQRLKEIEDELSQDPDVVTESGIDMALRRRGIGEKPFNPSLFNGIMINKMNYFKESGEDLDDDHLGKVAFTESVKEFTGLSMLSVLGLENISGKRYENLANAYARNRV